MKIAFISLSTPTYNNVRAASALPYHLILGSQGHQFRIYSFDINQIRKEEKEKTEKTLHTDIKILPRPKWIRWMFKLRLSILRVFLKYPFQCFFRLDEQITNEIKGWNPDKIWLDRSENACY